MPSALELEWRESCRRNPPDTMRALVRTWCSRELEKDALWTPGPGLVRLLKSLGIAREFVNFTPHAFITVRLRRTMPAKEAYLRIKDLKYVWLQGAHAVLEGFGSANPHLHVLVKGTPHKGNCIKQLSHRFGIEREMVDFKRSECPELYATRRAYLDGTKVTDKMEKVEADIAFREANDIPHLINF